MQRSPTGRPGRSSRGEASSEGVHDRAGRAQAGVPAGGGGRVRSAGIFERRQRPGDQDRQQEVHEADGRRGNGQHHGRRREGGDEHGRSSRGVDGGSENCRIPCKIFMYKEAILLTLVCCLPPFQEALCDCAAQSSCLARAARSSARHSHGPCKHRPQESPVAGEEKLQEACSE